MRPKLTKEEELARRQKIEEGISLVGLKRLDYLGEPQGHISWRKQQDAKRQGNKSKDQTDRGKGAGSRGAKHVAGEK